MEIKCGRCESSAFFMLIVKLQSLKQRISHRKSVFGLLCSCNDEEETRKKLLVAEEANIREGQ